MREVDVGVRWRCECVRLCGWERLYLFPNCFSLNDLSFFRAINGLKSLKFWAWPVSRRRQDLCRAGDRKTRQD